jgi:hypothetical protein
MGSDSKKFRPSKRVLRIELVRVMLHNHNITSPYTGGVCNLLPHVILHFRRLVS